MGKTEMGKTEMEEEGRKMKGRYDVEGRGSWVGRRESGKSERL
jgi:hypothetical protein